MPKLVWFTILFFSAVIAKSQCTSTINTFPYQQDFETSNGGWVSGGTNNDWAWGNPNKSYIQNAGSGNNCWVTGTLNGSFYSYGARSYVMSPCFNFTSIVNPHVKMKIYWEGENQYDGTIFQYSINNGVTWNNVGNNLDPVDCWNSNWYNQSNINSLNTLANPKPGWAGTVTSSGGGCFGGGGSAGWVNAQHCMPYLAGESSVQFRFAFGAGTTCNDFDGFAFDQIVIGEAPPIAPASFTHACTGNPLQYAFTNTSSTCYSSLLWNFGDPGSGNSDTSTLSNPQHTFSNPGTYTVTLTATGPCGMVSTITANIVTLDMNISSTNLLCYGVNIATITATALNNPAGVASYTLMPVNQVNTNGFFNGLAAIAYNLTFLSTNGCSVKLPVSIYTPTPLVFTSLTSSSTACIGQNNASISALVNGGLGQKNYTLLPNNISNNSGNFTNLGSNTYTIMVTDANGCSISSSIIINQTSGLTISNFGSQNVLCNGASTGQANITAFGGSGNITYTLQPSGVISSNGLFNNVAAGNYTITASDANGCTISTAFTITQAPPIIINNVVTTKAVCNPNNSGSITISATNGVGNMEYSIGGTFTTNNIFNNIISNTYTVTVKDANGCTKTSITNVGSENIPTINLELLTQPSCTDPQGGIINANATSAATVISYTLNPGNITNTDGLFSGLGSGNYTITVIDANQCTQSTVVNLLTPGSLNFNSILVESDLCNQGILNRVTCSVNGIGTVEYKIVPGPMSNTTGVFTNLKPDTYYISATDANGCVVKSSFVVNPNQCCNKPYVANTFTPNRDGLNDELHLNYVQGVTIDKFIIVNRFGNVVFSSKHELDRWDGKFKSTPCDLGTYFYMVQYTCNKTKEKAVLKGDILLVR